MADLPFGSQFQTIDPVNTDNHQTRLAKLEYRTANLEATPPGSVTGAQVIAALGYTPQPALGYTPENVANKSNDTTMAADSATLYPTQHAAKTYADTKQASLGFTPEDVANKDIDGTLAANSDTKYPSQKATKTYADTKLSLSGGVLSGDLDISTGVHLDTDGSATFGASAALFSTAGDLSFSGTTHAGLRLNNLTTAERNAIVGPLAGMLIWNTTTGAINQYTGATWSAAGGGGDALTANPLSQFAATTSLQLAGVISDETGTGALVFANTPTLVTPILGTPTSGTLTNCTGLPISTGVSGLAAGIAAFLATPSSANLITAVTDETGTGALVFANTPTLVTPLLGTPTSGTLTNCTGLPVSTGVSGLAAGVAAFLATPSSANLIAAVTDETGTGALVFGTSPSLTTSATLTRTGLGSTPSEGFQLTNTTAAAAGAQQYSPSLRLTGQGWRTNATAQSEACDWRIYAQPVQGAADPTCNLLFDFSVNGGAFGTKVTISSSGNITIPSSQFFLCGSTQITSNSVASGGDVKASTSDVVGWSSRSSMTSPSDGVVLLRNNGLTDFTRLQFGGTTSSFPALKRAATVLECVLADDSARTQLYGATLRTNQTTVAALPSASTSGAGALAFVTDALAPAFGSNVAGSGAVSVPVYSDGTNWVVG